MFLNDFFKNFKNDNNETYVLHMFPKSFTFHHALSSSSLGLKVFKSLDINYHCELKQENSQFLFFTLQARQSKINQINTKTVWWLRMEASMFLPSVKALRAKMDVLEDKLLKAMC